MSSLLLKHIDTLATFDNQRRVLKKSWALIQDHWIEEVDIGVIRAGWSINAWI